MWGIPIPPPSLACFIEPTPLQEMPLFKVINKVVADKTHPYAEWQITDITLRGSEWHSNKH